MVRPPDARNAEEIFRLETPAASGKIRPEVGNVRADACGPAR
jgi:hypothetical protein